MGNEFMFLRDSTAASISTGSYSSACDDNIASLHKNAIMVFDTMPEAKLPETDYATVSRVDRERIRKKYPKPTMAKPPAISEDIDIL